MNIHAQIVYYQLMGVRNLCLALAKSIDVVVAAMEQETPETQPAASNPEIPGDAKCLHPLPQRIPIPAMGAKRFKCMVCNEDVVEGQS